MSASSITTTLFTILFLFMMIFLELFIKRGCILPAQLTNKYLPCLWLSLITLSLFISVRQITGPASSVYLRSITLLLLLMSEYLLAVYMLFRGIYVLFNISKEGLRHPTITAVNKLTKNSVSAYLYITFIILLFNISHILSLYSDLVHRQW